MISEMMSSGWNLPAKSNPQCPPLDQGSLDFIRPRSHLIPGDLHKFAVAFRHLIPMDDARIDPVIFINSNNHQSVEISGPFYQNDVVALKWSDGLNLDKTIHQSTVRSLGSWAVSLNPVVTLREKFPDFTINR